MANTTREQRKEEALKRMKKLDLHENVIHEFENEDKLNKSEWMGALFWLTPDEQRVVDRIEEQYNATVYHVIFSPTSIGDMLSLLYVSDYPEEWERDNEDIDEGYALAWVENLSDEWCSEFGTIGIRPSFGGVVRTA